MATSGLSAGGMGRSGLGAGGNLPSTRPWGRRTTTPRPPPRAPGGALAPIRSHPNGFDPMSPPPGLQTRFDMYRAMVRARQLEQRAYDLFMEGIVKGTTHPGLGQEAGGAGFATGTRPTP